jgi:predicted component of viral defense system (DUF524 family)
LIETKENISFNLYSIKNNSNLIFDNSKRCPIILYENYDYIFKIKYLIPTNIEKVDFFEVIDSNQNKTEYILKFNSSNYVGLLNLSFLNIFNNLIEIETKKINYQIEYNNLILKIAELDNDLVTRARSIFEAGAKVNEKFLDDDILLNTKFAFIKSKIISGEFENLYNSFIKKPLSRIKTNDEIKYSWDVDNLDLSNYIDGLFSEIISDDKGNNYPLKINSNYFEDEIDNIENQFIKYVLEFIIQLLENYDSKILSPKLNVLKFEIAECLRICYNIKSNPVFKTISKLKRFPSKSNTLQAKYPYREIFHLYMMLFLEVEIEDNNMASSLSLPMKDLPQLYEYWCFLTFVEILNKEFGNSNLLINQFIKYNSQNLCYTICPTHEALVYDIDASKKIKLFYQKSYSAEKLIFDGRSYSHSLDPDLSLELFSDEKLVAIIHFDSKYKLDNLNDFKNEDIDKMHTYKDAILGTIGAYVLYPGNLTKSYIQEERNQSIATDFFPSVGAFELNIDNAKTITEQTAVLKLINEFIKIDIDLVYKGIFTKNEIKYNYIKRLID